jgi:hypothetical protein
VATLRWASTTDLKTFTPVSTELSNLPNGPGTICVLIHKNTAGVGSDYAGLLNSGASAWYHSLNQQTDDTLWDDDGLGSTFVTGPADDTTNWWWYAVDWTSGASTVARYHWRNHTAGTGWTHNNGGGTTSTRAGPGTSGWFRIGDSNDETTSAKDMALVAVWAGTRLADGDYAIWTKTSDVYNVATKPTLLVECNATTLVDLGLNVSTYSSANSSGTTLVGADPPTWTFDGRGTAAAAPILGPSFVPVPFMK